MLKLLAHELLYLQHIVRLNFITFYFIYFLDVNFVSFHDHEFFNITTTINREDISAWILNAHS